MIFDFRPVVSVVRTIANPSVLLRAGFGLGGLSWQNYHVPFEAILMKMGIKGESMVESVMVNQNETGAIHEAKIFVIVPDENRFGRLLNCFAHTNYFDATLVESLHKLDGRSVADLGANESVGFGKDKVRCQKLSPGLE
jgi:hypothetical protein